MSGFGSVNDAALMDLGRALRATGYRFVTITPASHERVHRRPGTEWANTPADVFGWSRPFRRDVLSGPLLDLAQKAGVLARYEDGWRSLVRFSSLGDELFVHSAFPTTDHDSVFFGPDTGRLVEAIVSHLSARRSAVRRAVDVGCGSGAGAVAIAKRSPEAEVVGLDINPAALRATALNATLAGVANVVPRHSDMLRDVEGSFDLMVSNPPFMIDAAGRAYRDGGGHLGTKLPLACVDAAIERLAPRGSLVLFCGAVIIAGNNQFHHEAARRLAHAGLDWDYRETDPDAYGEELDGPRYREVDRIALGVLTATKRD
jgi:methylase of polypeptide subunit release factors